MSSKLEYLQRYNSKKRIKKRKLKGDKSNFSIVDDDIDWHATAVVDDLEKEDSDDAPLIVAEVKDETVVKWQPLGTKESSSHNDLSPPRRKREEANYTHREFTEDPIEDLSPPRLQDFTPPVTRHSIKKAGLPRDEIHSYSKNEESATDSKCSFRTNDSGKSAETVYRNRFGKRDKKDPISKEEEDIFTQWGRGVSQTKATIQKMEDENYEMSKPLARYADDEDLERMLKERLRDGDPMLTFTRKKKEERKNLPVKVKGKPQFKGNPAPNRFGIYPGYRWDGVNRSNGFEQAWFSRINNSKAIAEASYKWSVEDM